MSIFNKISTPVRIFRSFFFLILSILIILNFNSIISYAQESEILDDPSEIGEDNEQASSEETHPKIFFTQNIYHQHTGSSGGGGCYSIMQTGKRTETERCSGKMNYYSSYDRSQCSKCGAAYSGDQSGRRCWYTKTKTVSYTYYDLGCNKGGDTLLGSLTVEQSTGEWVKSLILTGFYETNGGMSVASQPYIWNGSSATDNNTYEVNNSGVYTLQLNADANANTAGAIVSVDVRNVDVTGPVIRVHSQEPSSDWTKDGVVVTLTDVADLQPDGSEGCGLHEMPYSYDGGKSWTAENTHIYLENGTHSIFVRDALANQSSYDVTFNNVDCSGPVIESVDYDHTKNIKDTVIVVTAKDLQPDGSEGIGLHDTPYSFDGGQTWTADNALPVNKNGTISIVVRDKLENEMHMEETVANLDCTGPEIIYKMEPDSWTRKNVIIKLEARDINEDGSEGIGLEENWYSLDGGITWVNKRELEYDKNRTITIIARDKNNNQSSKRIKIKQIDREEPWVSVKMEQIGSGTDMIVKLIATAGDDYSGLHDKAYSWDKGCTYGTDNTKIVTENGTYQITVRDKALNWRYALIEVDVFPIIEFPAFEMKEKKVESETENMTMEETTEEQTSEEYIVQIEERIEKPKTEVVQTIEEVWDWKDTLALISTTLLTAGVLALCLILWLCTIRIYTEGTAGTMKYMGRQWIRYKEAHFEIQIPMELIEKCMTTHFLLCPSTLFAILFKEKDMAFLFPEEICIIRKVEQNIEISLL